MLPAGFLNRRVTIQRRDTGTDDAGQSITTWTDVITLPANVRGQTGMGVISNSQGGVMAAVKAYSFRIRYRKELDEGMRVLFDGDIFDIRAVRHDLAKREWTDLVCEVGGNDG